MVSMKMVNASLRFFWVACLCTLLSCSESTSERTAAAVAEDEEQFDRIVALVNPERAKKQQRQLDSLFRSLHKYKGFNGTVLVTQYNLILYKGAFGYADFQKKDTLTTQKPFQLASVSKQFTAMAIMMLKEAGRLKYEDEVQRFFPDFPYECITIRHLLTHRSGLPNYTYFTEKYWPDRRTFISNEEVIRLMTEHKPAIYYQPDKRFNYSNTGYILLAAIVAKASGMPFEEFMEKKIFRPLDMKNSWVLTDKYTDIPPGHTARRRKREIDFLDGVQGDKGIYSTVEDLYKWDQALYTQKLVKRATLEEAFVGAAKETKKEDYGFGWRLRKLADTEPVEYHGGLWHGFNNYFMRNRKDHSAIIVLSNVTNGSLAYMQNVQAILYPEAVKPLVAEKRIKRTSKKKVVRSRKAKKSNVAAKRKRSRRNSS
ncbi:MAG: serine hydrolase [Adhaeribacter sp.]|nr:serine hydrolase [Adhaeribacter sp.]